MKIAKKFMALALAAVLSVGCAFGVSADGSRTKDVTVTKTNELSEIYEIVQKIEDTEGFKELKETVPAVADAFKKVSEGKMDLKGFTDVLKTLAEEATDETVKEQSKKLLRSWMAKISLQVSYSSE